jgi:two-component system, OmpR family, response regulator
MADSGARVLVIEDDPVLRDCIADEVRAAGHQVLARPDGTDLHRVTERFRPDAALLDVMLPGRSGLALAAELRDLDCALLFLTARDAVADRLAGFAVGADDYLVKPFVMAELLARLSAVLRRRGHGRAAVVRIDDLEIDEDAGEARRSGSPLPLTATELRLLVYLARNRGRVLSKTQILTQVWGYDAYDPNLVEAFVSGLRRKLEAAGPRVLHTVRGIGYRLSEPVREVAR